MDGASGTMQRLQSSATGKNRGNLDMHNNNFGGSSRPGIPPSHPNNHHHHHTLPYNSHIMGPRPISQSPGPAHSRSLSQPPIFNLDSLPPLSPLTYRDHNSADVSIVGDNRVVDSYARVFTTPVNRGGGEHLPPRRGHRRANSEIPLGFEAMIQSSPQLMPIGNRGVLDRSVSLDKPVQIVKQELEWNTDGKKSESDDLFNAYMNLDNMDTLNSSGTEEKDLESRASGSRVNGADSSDNEVESRINLNLHAANPSFGPGRAVGHHRSVSMDSYMGSLNFDDESMKTPHRAGQISPGNSANLKNLEFLKADFNATEMKKIGANEKLAEIAMGDPKRVKRILANRLSAARSKERKMRYISELEQKVQTLQTEATTLSAQLTMLQRDSSGLLNKNNELKFRLQAMEQQAQLKDALNNALSEEVHRLKIQAAATGHNGEVQLSNNMAHQLSLNPQMYQMHNQAHRQQHNQMQPQQENNETDKP